MAFMIDKVITEGIEMAYCRFGQGKRTLVILPGLSVQSVLTAAAAVENRYKILKEDFTVYLFERRANLPASYTIVEMAEDTAKVIQALGLRNCCVFGASQGGMIGIVLAAEYPALVSKLALGSTAARANPLLIAVLSEWVACAKKNDAEALYLSFGEKVYPQETFRQYREAFQKMAEKVTDAELQRFITMTENTLCFDITEQLKRIACPVFAIGDTDDRVLGKAGTLEIVTLLQDKTAVSCYLYEGYGHAAYDAAPDYPERLYNFFKQP